MTGYRILTEKGYKAVQLSPEDRCCIRVALGYYLGDHAEDMPDMDYLLERLTEIDYPKEGN